MALVFIQAGQLQWSNLNRMDKGRHPFVWQFLNDAVWIPKSLELDCRAFQINLIWEKKLMPSSNRRFVSCPAFTFHIKHKGWQIIDERSVQQKRKCVRQSHNIGNRWWKWKLRLDSQEEMRLLAMCKYHHWFCGCWFRWLLLYAESPKFDLKDTEEACLPEEDLFCNSSIFFFLEELAWSRKMYLFCLVSPSHPCHPWTNAQKRNKWEGKPSCKSHGT